MPEKVRLITKTSCLGIEFKQHDTKHHYTHAAFSRLQVLHAKTKYIEIFWLPMQNIWKFIFYSLIYHIMTVMNIGQLGLSWVYIQLLCSYIM